MKGMRIFAVRWGSSRLKAITQLNRMKLAQLLRLFGWRGILRKGTHKRIYGLRLLSEAERYSALEFARQEYRQRIGRCHPDRGGSHEDAACLNAVMDRIDQLFRRKGIALLLALTLAGGCAGRMVERTERTERTVPRSQPLIIGKALMTPLIPPLPARSAMMARAVVAKAAPAVPAVTLSWEGVAGVTGYRLYYGYLDRTYSVMIDCGNQTSVTVSNVSPFNLYYFAVTAYAGAGESELSEQKDYTLARWEYPPGREKFSWSVEASGDLWTWEAVSRRIEATNAAGFYRLRGTFVAY